MNGEASSAYSHGSRRSFISISPLSCIRLQSVLILIFNMLKMASINAILFIKRDEEDKAPLKVFLCVYCLLNAARTIAFYFRNRALFQIHRISDYDESDDVMLLNTIFEATILFWCFVGYQWLHECDKCKAANTLLYYTSLCWILFEGFALFVPLLACVLLLLLVHYVRPKFNVITYSAEDGIPGENTTCTICLNDYVSGDGVKFLSCNHHFHTVCIDEWFDTRDTCSLCNMHTSLLYELLDENEAEV
ncbi:hypothetical protein PAPHI01_1529 [Pancytospora philotis]|nr:hypothetical protein PAPHI01_1529 [Pancytospora philotis]